MYCSSGILTGRVACFVLINSALFNLVFMCLNLSKLSLNRVARAEFVTAPFSSRFCNCPREKRRKTNVRAAKHSSRTWCMGLFQHQPQHHGAMMPH